MKQFIRSFLCVTLLFSAAAYAEEKRDCGSSDCGTASHSTASCDSCSNGSFSCSTFSCDNSGCGNNASCNNCGSASSMCTSCNDCHTVFLPRSTGDEVVNDLLLFPLRHEETDCWWAALGVSLEYRQSFHNKRIARDVFGSNVLNFVGSLATTSTTNLSGCTLLADNFGLSSQGVATLTLEPKIKRLTTRFNLHVGLDEWVSGLWFKVVLPLEWARWQLNTCTSSTTGTTGFDVTPFTAGCIGTGAVTPASDFTTALGGEFLFGGMQTNWAAGRFSFCEKSKTRLADVHFYLGWDFWNCDDYGIGAYLVGVAPAGNRPDIDHVFSPVIGNGHYGELGGGIKAWAELWNCNDDHIIQALLVGHATHMFKNCQRRLFDLNDKGCLSRYLLLREFTQTGGTYTATGLLNGTAYTARNAEVSVSAKGEAALEFRYLNSCGWSTGLGFNIYGRSHEKVCLKGPSELSVGIRGCTPSVAYCFPTILNTATPAVEVITSATPTAVPLIATQSNATISSCGTIDNAAALRVDAVGTTAGRICINPCALGLPAVTADVTEADDIAAIYPLAVNSSTPVLLTDDALDLRSAGAGRHLSYKVFGHVDYAWLDCDWAPYVSLGAEGEFAKSSDYSTLNQWGIWVAGGIEF